MKNWLEKMTPCLRLTPLKEQFLIAAVFIMIVCLSAGFRWPWSRKGCEGPIPVGYACCEQKVLPAHECCGYARIGPDQICCGGRKLMDLKTQICCAGIVHPRETTECCTGAPRPRGTCSEF